MTGTNYFIAAISNDGGAPEQAYRKMQSAGACPEAPFAGKNRLSTWTTTDRNILPLPRRLATLYYDFPLFDVISIISPRYPVPKWRHLSFTWPTDSNCETLTNFSLRLCSWCRLEMFKFEVPSLMVGTLDSLMVSSLTFMDYTRPRFAIIW